MSTPESHLFDPGEQPDAGRPIPSGSVRYQPPERLQLEWRAAKLDDLIAADHRVRLVWEWVCDLHLDPLYSYFRTREGHPGRPPIDPRILVALWLYATLDGIGSARHLDRLCKESAPYQWICGGVSVNYHTLADFRVEQEAFLDSVLTQSVASLLEAGLVTMEFIAQDGKRVPASAGSSSARSHARTRELLEQAEVHVRQVRRELAADPGAISRREAAARERAIRERRDRLARAKEVHEQIQAERDKLKPSVRKRMNPPRISTTDPDCRKLKLGHGGYEQAYNVQFATDRDSYVILGCSVGNNATDFGQISLMADQLEGRYGRLPRIWVADKSYEKHACIRRMDPARTGCELYVPERTQPQQGRPYAPAANDTIEITRWKARMQADATPAIYAQRAPVAECVNAQAHNRGLNQLRVRGMQKVRACVLWYVLAHNLMRIWRLQAA